MRQIFAIYVALLAAIWAGAPAPVAAQTAFAPVAVVNDDVITYYDVDQRARILQLSGAEASPQLNGAALEQLVDDQLRLQAAEQAQMTIDDAEVAAGVTQFAGRYGLEPDAFQRRLASLGVAPESVERLARAQLVWRDLMTARFGARATPSELELDGEIELAASGRVASYRIGEIAIASGPGREQEALQRITRVRREALSGADFSALARRFSEAPSGRNGGDVGFVAETSLPPDLAEMVGATPQGGVTEPYQNPGSVSILKVYEKREDAPPWAQDAQMSLRQITVDGDDDEARARAQALSEDAGGCGAIPNLSDGMTVDSLDRKIVRELPDPIRGAVQLLNQGQASRPVQLGDKTAVFIVCDRTGGVDAETRNQLREQIRNRRLNRLAEGYLQDLRREAVIERR